MSTVDKGPSSRLSGAATDAANDTAKHAGDTAKSAGQSTTPAAEATSSTGTKDGAPRIQPSPPPPPSRSQPTTTAGKQDGHKSSSNDVKSSSPKIVPTPPTSTESAPQAAGSKTGANKKSKPARSSSAPADGAKSSGSDRPASANKPTAPLDPGLAMVDPGTSTSTDAPSKRDLSARSVDTASTEELPVTGEQLVIAPVDDLVGPAPQRRKRRVRRASPTGPDEFTETEEFTGPNALAPTHESTAVMPAVVHSSAGDHQTVALPSTVARPSSRGTRRRARVRRVTRVVRHIDPWSAFKAGLLFSLVGYVVCLTSGVLLWQVAEQTGTIDNVQGWFTQFGWESFELKGGEIYHNAWILGLFLAVGFTGLIVLAVTLFNLVSDIVGGIRISVLEEEVVERRVTTSRRYAVRRPTVVTHDPSATNWSVDPDGPSSPPVVTSPLPSTTTNWSVDD